MNTKNLDDIDLKLLKRMGLSPYNTYISEETPRRIAIVDSSMLVTEKNHTIQTFDGTLSAYKLHGKGALIKRANKELIGKIDYYLEMDHGIPTLKTGMMFAKHDRVMKKLLTALENIGTFVEPDARIVFKCHCHHFDKYKDMGYTPISRQQLDSFGYGYIQKSTLEYTPFDNNVKAMYDEIFGTNFREKVNND